MHYKISRVVSGCLIWKPAEFYNFSLLLWIAVGIKTKNIKKKYLKIHIFKSAESDNDFFFIKKSTSSVSIKSYDFVLSSYRISL